MRHFPLLTTLPQPAIPRKGPSARAPPTSKEGNNLLRSTRFQQQVDALMPPAPVGEPASVLNRVLQQAWQTVKPAARQRTQHPRSHSILRGWLQAARLARIQRLLRKACKDRKREHIDSLLQEAESSKHPSSIFSVVRRLAPKTRSLRVQLRDKDGKLLAGAEESDQIASFLRGVFNIATSR